MRVLGILPIKAHSERVPNKNFRELGGRPLWRWTLDAMLEAGIPEILIETDCPQRFPESVLPGGPSGKPGLVHVSPRPMDLCGDTVPMTNILRRVCERFEDVDVVIQAHATNPFVLPDTYARACTCLTASPALASVFGATAIRARCWSATMDPLNHDPAVLAPTQDLAPVVVENSAFYVFRRHRFMQVGRRVCDPTMPIILHGIETLDIDDEHDWQVAALVARGMTA